MSEGRTLVQGGIVITQGHVGEVIQSGAVLVEGSLIADVGERSELEKKYPEANRIDCGDRLIMPGLINAHTHLYSALARGMPFTAEAPSNFVEILERVWWKLDKLLDDEGVYMSSLVGLIDCLRHGTTTLLDHHASPFQCTGSLARMAGAVDEVGLRACLAYEVSDRDGPDVAQAGIEENRSFIEWCRKEKRENLAASFGLHASFTLSDETLARCVEAADGAGFHVHLAEDRADLEDARSRWGTSVVGRFKDAGILGERTLAIHGIHIDEDDMGMLAETGTKVVHNPQSNCNNAVGTADVLGMLEKGVTVGLGSDGFSANPLDELRAANILHKLVRKDPRVGTAEVCDLLFRNNPRIAGLFFGEPVGVLKPGAFADLIVLDYRPPTPVHSQNLIGHILFGIAGTPVDSVMVGGRFLMKSRELVGIDEERILARSREAATKLWKSL
jgi:putative selenium metabolism protein SsnA